LKPPSIKHYRDSLATKYKLPKRNYPKNCPLSGKHELRLWQRNHDILHFKEYGIDGTNNTTARLIGLNGKIRYKSMRGFKSKSSLNNFLQTPSFLWNKKQEVNEVDLSCVS